MIRQATGTLNRETYNNDSADQKRLLADVIKWFNTVSEIRERSPAILTVHRDTGFGNQLTSTVTCVEEAVHIPRGLRNFRSKPQFDLVFYSPLHGAENLDHLLEDFCYCRMLLRPGGFIFFRAEPDAPWWANCWFSGAGKEKMSWLRQAGYMKVMRTKIGTEMVVCGQRPLPNY